MKKVRVRNMKKFGKLLTAAIALTMLVSGCAEKSTVPEANVPIIEATEAIKSYKGTTDLSFTAVSGGSKISMKSVSEIALNEEPFFADIILNTSSYGVEEVQNTNSRMILSSEEGTDTVYLLHDGEWNKEVVQPKNFRLGAYQYDVAETAILLMEKSPNFQSFGEEDYNGVKAQKYEGTIPLTSLPDLFKMTGSLSLVGTDIGDSYYGKCSDQFVTLWVDSNNVIIGYEMDLTDVVTKLFEKLYSENNITDEAAMIKFESYIAKGTISEYDTEIYTELPEGAVNAKDINGGTVDGTVISSGTEETEE